MKKKQLAKILQDIHQVLTKMELPCCEEHMSEKIFGMGVVFKDFNDFKGRVGFFIDEVRECITISMSTPDKIPEEKVAVVMDIINRLNCLLITEHLWLDQKTNDVVIMKGISLTGKNLDREEFEAALMNLFGNGVPMLQAVLEQVASDEKPDVLVNRIFKEHASHSHDFKEKTI